MFDRDALDTAGQIERPGNGIGIGCVDPLDDFHLRSSEVLVPAELLEDAECELRITIPDFRAGRVGAFGEQIVMLVLFDLLAIFHNLALDHALDAEAGAERSATFLHRQTGVVEYRRSRVPEFRRSPAWPRQAVIIAADFGIVLRCPQGDQVELGLVLHVGLEALRRLTAISGRPPAAIDLAQDVLSRYRAVLHLDVLEHLVGEAELLREHVHHVVVILRFEDRLYDLLAPLQGTVGCGTGAVHLKACAGRQKVRAVLAFREHRPGRGVGVAHHQQLELFDSANRFRHPGDGIDAMPHHEHCLQRVGLTDLILRQQRRVKPARAWDSRGLHQGLAGEARAHPVDVDLPHPAPMLPCLLGKTVIERQRRHIEAEIGGTLDIGVAAENICSSAGMTDIAGGEQQDATCPHICSSGRKLRLAHRPDQRRRLLVGENFGDMLDLGFRQTGDALDLVRRPFRDFLADILDAIDPLLDKFLVFPTVLENVPEHPVDRRDVNSGPHPDIFGRVRRGSRHSRVDDNEIRAVELLALQNVLQRNRMRLGGVAAHQQNSLGVADVVIAVGHRAVAPGVGYPSDGGGVTDPGLVIGIVGSPEGGELAVEVGRFVGEFGRTEPVDRI